ncbi:MAG: glycosyltransferase [Planctomycetia bacterium]|nr:glycosyltransferase [Planctomycetia bacterium]
MNHGRMTILHVVAGLPPAGGGLSELVPRVALEATRLGHDVTIATVTTASEPLAPAADEATAGGVKIVRFAPSAPRVIFFSWAMRRGLEGLVAAADLVHVHSNWTFPVWWAARCARRAGKPLVMSPHGCLDPVRLAHSAWKKRLAGVFDRRALRQAAAIHATSDAERNWIERYVGGRPRIAVIPNGVELLPLDRPAKPTDRMRQVLCLGRLHPLKGLDLLLDAWRLAAGEMAGLDRWQLVIAGPDEQGTRAALERHARSLGLANVVFSGPLYAADKTRAFAAADLFVLPSRSENFGIAAAEALAAGLPLIATKAAPWSEIHGSCGWWVDVGAEPIARALTAAMRLDDAERAAMGARGRALVEAKYQWASVGRAMTALYERLVAGRR